MYLEVLQLVSQYKETTSLRFWHFCFALAICQPISELAALFLPALPLPPRVFNPVEDTKQHCKSVIFRRELRTF